MHFYCEKNTCGQKLGPGGLIDPPGSEDVKRTGGGENVAGAQLPNNPDLEYGRCSNGYC